VTSKVAARAPQAARAFEIKYVLPARHAGVVCAWLDARCDRDPSHPEGHVRTLYLDTPDLRFLREKVEGDTLKTKIRLRWYASDARTPAAGPVWLEIKQRDGTSRAKTRLEFREQVAGLDAADHGDLDLAHVVRLVREQGLDLTSAIRPTLALNYLRSRWVDPETGVRVAVDRAIDPAWGRGRGRPPAYMHELPMAVVEFKGREPEIPRSLGGVTRFGGRRVSFSKYFSCYARLFPGVVSDDGGIL
jgi:hypothetical protein